MKLYIVRHGQTDWNKLGLVQGLTDIALNETGVQQARSLRQRLLERGVKFDICYASPLQRAYQTAEIITKKECDIITNELIIERCFGKLERNGTNPHDLGLDVYSRKVNTGDYGIEPILQMLDRTNEFYSICKE